MVESLSLADIVPTDSIEEPLEQLILEQLITEVRGSSLAPHYVIWVCHHFLHSGDASMPKVIQILSLDKSISLKLG